jgi:hypothetical protein
VTPASRPRAHSIVSVSAGMELAGLERLDPVVTDEVSVHASDCTGERTYGAPRPRIDMRRCWLVGCVGGRRAAYAGRYCLEDGCRWRYEPGVRSRRLERQLRSLAVPVLATALIKILAGRGLRLVAFRAAGCWRCTRSPHRALLGLPGKGKRIATGAATSTRRPGRWCRGSSEHEPDAVVC